MVNEKRTLYQTVSNFFISLSSSYRIKKLQIHVSVDLLEGTSFDTYRQGKNRIKNNSLSIWINLIGPEIVEYYKQFISKKCQFLRNEYIYKKNVYPLLS